MALASDTPRVYELGDYNHLPVKATTKIYEGAAVGIDAASGYARGLNAGDAFQGFAERTADNSAGSNGDVKVSVRTKGVVKLAIAGAGITDIGKPVYASDDDTFVLTATGNSYIGKVKRIVSTGVAVVAFDVRRGGAITGLTTSVGTASDTIADVGAAFNQAALNNIVASLAAKINALAAMLK